MHRNVLAQDWTATLLCALTDASAKNDVEDASPDGKGQEPLGASLRELCAMMGVQGWYLQDAKGVSVSLGEEASQILGIVDMLACRRATESGEVEASIRALEKKQDNKAKDLQRVRGLIYRIQDCRDAIDFLQDHVDVLCLFVDYGEALAAEDLCENSDAREVRVNAEQRLLGRWAKLCKKRSCVSFGGGSEETYSACVSLLESCEGDRGVVAEVQIGQMLGKLSKHDPSGGVLLMLVGHVDAFRMLYGYVDALAVGFVSKRDPAKNKIMVLRQEYEELCELLQKRYGSGWAMSQRGQILREYAGALGIAECGNDNAGRDKLDAIKAGLRENQTQLGEALLSKRRDEEYPLKRSLDDFAKEMKSLKHSLMLSVTLTPVLRESAVGALVLEYNKSTKKFVAMSPSDGSVGKQKRLGEWVSWLEATYGADDVYVYLEYRRWDARSNDKDAQWDSKVPLRTIGPFAAWLAPADLGSYDSIYQSTGNPADYIYPVREYGAPFEPFGNRRKVAFENLCARIDEAQKAGRAVNILYETNKDLFLERRDTFVVHINGRGVVESLESVELDRYRPVVPLRRYPRSEDGEIPTLCMDLNGGLWLVDLASRRIELDTRETRDQGLFDEGLDFGGFLREREDLCSRMDCWCVASNYDDGGAAGGHSVRCLGEDETVRLRFFEICRDDGSHGHVLSRAAQVLRGHRWQKDEGACVLDGDGREVESVWQTPFVEGFTLVGVQDLQRFVLSFGSDVVVEGPDWLRAWHLGVALRHVKRLYARRFE